jgi:malate dehydrogenase (oxaloacetate-decarboxylating)
VRTYTLRRDASGVLRVVVPHRGQELLKNPMYNRSTAFTREERAALGLEGLLPHAVSTMEQQARRAYRNVARKTDALERYIGLAALQDRNEHLFYRVLVDHIEEFLPIVYTPTVALATQEFSHIFRSARGLWITPAHRGRIHEVLGSAPFDDVRLVVATDNERILGLGDQGAGGIAIPIGKLALYTAAAGIPPWQTLPVSLDVGTDNRSLLEDELYLGWRQPRLRGPEYDALLEEFVHALKRRFPRALLQWEDFKKQNAFNLLARFRGVLPSFNDDVQGTGSVVLAALLASARVTGRSLVSERVVILGAGAVGVGIAEMMRAALASAGLSGPDLTRAVALIDLPGLLQEDDPLDEFQRPLAWPRALAEAAGLAGSRPRDLLSTIRALKPTVLVGVAGQRGAFSAAAVRAMANHVERPVILPLSNPTSQSEAEPAEILAWTEGRALVATGSPFPAVPFRDRTVRIGQSNNAFIFPGVGLGALVAEAREVTDGMFLAAARALAGEVSAEDLAAGSLFPPVAALRRVTARVAEDVVREARDSRVGRALPDADVAAAVAAAVWEPSYLPLEPGD